MRAIPSLHIDLCFGDVTLTNTGVRMLLFFNCQATQCAPTIKTISSGVVKSRQGQIHQHSKESHNIRTNGVLHRCVFVLSVTRWLLTRWSVRSLKALKQTYYNSTTQLDISINAPRAIHKRSNAHTPASNSSQKKNVSAKSHTHFFFRVKFSQSDCCVLCFAFSFSLFRSVKRCQRRREIRRRTKNRRENRIFRNRNKTPNTEKQKQKKK